MRFAEYFLIERCALKSLHYLSAVFLRAVVMLAVLVLLLLAVLPAQAESESNFYARAGLQAAEWDLGNGSSSSDTGLVSVGVGYQWLSFLAIEIGYTDFGEISSGSVNAKADAFQTSVVYSQPLHDAVAAQVELGVDVWSGSGTLGGADEFVVAGNADDGVDLFYGLGVSYILQPGLFVTAGYQFHKLDEVEIDALAFGVRYQAVSDD